MWLLAVSLSWTEIVLAVLGLFGLVASGALGVWIAGRQRREVTHHEAEEVASRTFKTDVADTGGALLGYAREWLDRQEARLRDLERQLGEALATLDERDKTIRELRAQLREAKAEIARGQAMIEDLRLAADAEKNELRAEVAALDRVVAGLERRLAEVEPADG